MKDKSGSAEILDLADAERGACVQVKLGSTVKSRESRGREAGRWTEMRCRTGDGNELLSIILYYGTPYFTHALSANDGVLPVS